MNRPLQLTLYTSPGCCLCEDLREQLSALREEFDFTLQEVNIKGDPALEQQYRSQIPVLLVNGRKTVKYRISTPALRQRLRWASGGLFRGLLHLR